MQLPKTFVEDLILSHEYDPVKAHEYYLKTRQLKGRKSAQPKVQAYRTSKKTVKKAAPKKSAAQKRKELEAYAARLKQRLEVLRQVLAELVKQAKARSGVKATKKTSHKKTDTHKKQTAQQKKAAAKRSKEYYEKHKSPQQKIKEIKAQIKAVQEKIQKALAQLEKARKRKAGSVGASKYSTYR